MNISIHTQLLTFYAVVNLQFPTTAGFQWGSTGLEQSTDLNAFKHPATKVAGGLKWTRTIDRLV